jgi:excisionase family DNA binding protein
MTMRKIVVKGAKMEIIDHAENARVDFANDPKFPVKLAALKLGVSAQTVYREIASGRLKCYWIGNSIRVGLSHINAYLASNSRHAMHRRTASEG